MNDRFVARIQQAAALLDCPDDRDAVMVGAVVRTCIRLRYWNVWAALTEAERYGHQMGIDMGQVDSAMISPMVHRFNAALQFIDL